jgi:hypothetical protein
LKYFGESCYNHGAFLIRGEICQAALFRSCSGGIDEPISEDGRQSLNGSSVMSPTLRYFSFFIPAKAGIQNTLKFLDSGSRFACPE